VNQPEATKIGNTKFHWGQRTYVMGIINTSPESFSGDGVTGVEAAVAQGKRFVREGVDILDVGGQSTRPGSQEITLSAEIERLIPVIRQLSAAVTVPVSVDTFKYEVAKEAIAAGAAMINDQWG